MTGKRKYLPAVLLTAVLCLFAGCGSGETEVKFSLMLENQAGSELYGIHCEYALGDMPAGGQEAARTPEMAEPFVEGAEVWFTFFARDFPDNADLLKFTYEFYAVGADGAETPIGERTVRAAKYGAQYDFILSGGPAGYVLEPTS